MIELKQNGMCKGCGFIELETLHIDTFFDDDSVIAECVKAPICERAYNMGYKDGKKGKKNDSD